MITIPQPKPETPEETVVAYLGYRAIECAGDYVLLVPAKNPAETEFTVKLTGKFARAWLAGASPEAPGGSTNE